MSTSNGIGDAGDTAQLPISSPATEVPQSPRKRKMSPNSAEETNDEKRLRAASDEPFDLEALLAQATTAAAGVTEDGSAAIVPSDEKIKHEDTDGNGYAKDPHLQNRISSLPILDSASWELLKLMIKEDYLQTVMMITIPNTENGEEYSTKKALFDGTKKFFAPTDFLSAEETGMTTPYAVSVLRKANLVTFVCRAFGGLEFDFALLNTHFMDVFVPIGGELESGAASLFLDLKTQIYISSVLGGMTTEEALHKLFPENFGVKLLERHPDKEMTLSESKFLTELSKRRGWLKKASEEDANALAERFPWEGFLATLFDYLSPTWGPGGVDGDESNSSSDVAGQNGQTNGIYEHKHSITDQEIEDDVALAAAAALNGVGVSSHDGLPYEGHGMHSGHNGQHGQNNGYGSTLTPFPSGQSAPTHVLYEQARQAAVNKSAPHSRRPGIPSQRRPWSQEEENALMAGLDAVRGPHWSQILILYGENGQVSDVLKDRSQVQLKDKARNLKLFFLKSNIEVPYYLRCVTGELKTRAPSLAQRKEAEERSRAEGQGSEAPRFPMPMGGMNGHQQLYQQHPPQHHHSPYGPPPTQYQQPPPQQPHPLPQERSSSDQGTEILDPVGPDSENQQIQQIKSQPAAVIPLPPDQAQTQEQAVQQAMQEMSADDHQLANRLRAEVDRHDAAEKSSTS